MTRIVTEATKLRVPVAGRKRAVEARTRVAGPEVAGMVLWPLPEPPSANRYWRVYRGRAVVSSEAQAYKNGVAMRASVQHLRPFAAGVPVRVVLRWYRAKRMGDLDNRIKVTLDALKGVLYVDDKQVVEIHATRHESPRAGRLEVEVHRVAP